MIHCSNGPPVGHVGHFMVIIDGAQKVFGHMFVKDELLIFFKVKVWLFFREFVQQCKFIHSKDSNNSLNTVP